MGNKIYSRVWDESAGIYAYIERHNYQTHRLSRTELLSALYLYLHSTRGIKIDPSCGQLSQEPYPSEEFLLETWDEDPTPTEPDDG